MANPDIYIHPSKGTIGFSGANTGTIQIRTAESGDLHFEGDQGSLLTITDDLSDSLFSVNDAAGMPVFEVFADDTIKAYRNNEAKLEIDPDNNRVRVRDNLLVSGDLTVSGDITSASASHEATSYTASTHVSGLSGYFGKAGIGSPTIDAGVILQVTKTDVGDNEVPEVIKLSTLNSASPSWSTTDGLCIGAQMKKANGTTIAISEKIWASVLIRKTGARAAVF